MSSSNFHLTQDQFLCSICLDVFTDPVATPCGHNFCQTCITKHWDVNIPCECPLCKEVFFRRPELRVNTLISQMVARVRQSAEQEDSRKPSKMQYPKQEGITCDICTGTKLRAFKSCLVCLTSYCETHLQPHLTVTGLSRHQLINPVENLQGRMCMKHEKHLELFCKTDQECICTLCMVLDHKTHDVVPMKEEYEERKAALGKTDAEIQEMITERHLKIREIKRAVELSNDAAEQEKEEGVQVFTALMEVVQRDLNEFIKRIDEKRKPIEKEAQCFITELEQEISTLMKRSGELEQLSRSDDHLHLIQTFPSMNATPSTKDWTEVRVCPPRYEGTALKAVDQLEETFTKEIKRVFEAELKRVQQFAVDLTLDPDTANPWLVLSEDGKQVNCGVKIKDLPENPKRFSFYASVLGKQSFTSGRFYYEVQVKDKTKWDLGVARESINRKDQINLSPQNGYWAISLRNGNEYKALADPRVRLSPKSQPQKVGVFVDYEEGLVSFYDADAATRIYSFTGCSFDEKLYPFFNPCNNEGGKNSAPLVICQLQNVKFNVLRIYSRIKRIDKTT